MRNLINAAVAGDAPGFWNGVLLFAVLIIVLVVFQAVRRFAQEHCRALIENTLKRRLFSNLVHGDVLQVQGVHTGEWANRFASDTQTVADGVVTIVPAVAGMAVQLFGSLLLLSIMLPGALWILVPVALAAILLTYRFRRSLKVQHKAICEADGRLRSFFIERLGSLAVIKSFLQEDETAREADGLMEDHYAARMRRNRLSNMCNTGFAVAMRGIYLLAVVYCGYGILQRTLSYGTLVAAIQLVGQVQSPLANITGCVPKIAALIGSAERLMEADEIREQVVVHDLECGDCTCQFAGLEFKNVYFEYPRSSEGATTVACPDLLVKKGEFVALAGPSGGGKSTTLRLMMALHPPTGGRCSVLLKDGGAEPLTPAWRSLFAYVPQGNQLLSGTIRDVVAFGNEEAACRDDDIRAALYVACADFVWDLPDGMDTMLGEGGLGLSEGQMQRIAVARAVFANRPILLLDEATSSLDSANERRLLENLRAMTDKTVVIVTHRPAALEVCDRVVNF